MKKLTLALTAEEIAATLTPIYECFNRDSKTAYEIRRDFPETLFDPNTGTPVEVCETRVRDYENRIYGIERMLAKTCGVEFSHCDHFSPCHEYEKVYMSVNGKAYPVFRADE